MPILTIPQLELLVFLESSTIPEWVLKPSGYGIIGYAYGYHGYGDGSGDGEGSEDGYGNGSEYGDGFGDGYGAGKSTSTK